MQSHGLPITRTVHLDSPSFAVSPSFQYAGIVPGNLGKIFSISSFPAPNA